MWRLQFIKQNDSYDVLFSSQWYSQLKRERQRTIGFVPKGFRELAWHTVPTLKTVPPRATGSALTAFGTDIYRCSTNQPRRGLSVVVPPTGESATYPCTDNESPKKPTSEMLTVNNPLCSCLNENTARALQSSVYHSS